MVTKSKKGGIAKKAPKAKAPAGVRKNVDARIRKLKPPCADKATRAAAKSRRAELYDFWARGINPTAVFERTGVPVSTVKADYAKFAADAADNADVNEKRARVEGWISKTIEQADDTYHAAKGDDARGRAAALNAKLKAIEHYSRINGLEVLKIGNANGEAFRVEATDPRLDPILAKLDALGVTVDALLGGEGDAGAGEGRTGTRA